MITIEIIKGNLLEQPVDAIVNPANTSGYMGYGAAKAIVLAGGKAIEQEAVSKAPLIIGDAVVTTAGTLPFKCVIHTATMDDPNEPIERGVISKALLGAVLMADDLEYQSLAIPGIGTGLGGVTKEIAAEAMIEPLRNFIPQHLKKIIFVDLSDDMVEAWKKAMK